MCENKQETKKFVAECQVLSNVEIAPKVYKMILGGENILPICQQAKAGQFLNVYLKDKSTLLPRPISICSVEKDRLEIVYKVVGKGTQELSNYEEGDGARISSSLGNGYDLEDLRQGDRALLVGGGVGIPPMIQLAKELARKKVSVTAIFGYQDETFLTEDVKEYCHQLYVCTETGCQGFKGNVVELMKAYSLSGDQVFSCGPKPMLKALAGYCEEQQIPLQVSLEERMGCGFGGCVGCTCKIMVEGRLVQKAVCKDGPVFKGNEVVWSE